MWPVLGHKSWFTKNVHILENIAHTCFREHNVYIFWLTILVGLHLGRLETRFGRLGISWDHLSFIDLESFS